MLADFSICFTPAALFQNHFFLKKKSGIPSVSNSLDSDQARHFVEPKYRGLSESKLFEKVYQQMTL